MIENCNFMYVFEINMFKPNVLLIDKFLLKCLRQRLHVYEIVAMGHIDRNTVLKEHNSLYLLYFI